MEITEVRVKLVPPGQDKLRAFCSITIDNDFVIRDLKVIQGVKGAFVAMPSRKMTSRCSRCGGKNHHGAQYCNHCGRRLPLDRGGRTSGTRSKMHADIAHPINSECRNRIQQRVLEVYTDELGRSQQPGYQPTELDPFDHDILDEDLAGVAAADTPAQDGRWGGEGPRASGESREPTKEDEPEGDDEQESGEVESGSGDDDYFRDTTSPSHPIREVRPRRFPWFGKRADGLRPEVEEGGGHGPASRSSEPGRPPSRQENRLKGEKEPVKPPRKRDVGDELSSEPEDNFGAGLFS